MFAQLNIVGVNSDKPVSKIDYLEQPVKIDNLFRADVDEYAYLNRYKPVIPKGQLYYHTEYSLDGLRVQGDSIIFGLLPGYYKLVGVLLTRKDMEPFCRFFHTDGEQDPYTSWRFDYPFYICDKDSSVVRAKVKYPDFNRREAFVNSIKNRFIALPSSNELKRKIASKEMRYVDQCCYVIEDLDGRLFYLLSEGESWINVEYVNKVVNLFKGKDFYLLKYDRNNFDICRGYITDYYTKNELPVDINVCGIYSEIRRNASQAYTFAAGLDNISSFKCEDVVIDGKDILVVLNIDGNIVTTKVAESFYEISFSVEDDNGNAILEYGIRHLSIGGRHLSMFSKDDCTQFKSDSQQAISLIELSNAEREARYAFEQENKKREILNKYGDFYGNKILQHKLAIGMTQEMCIESIGYPSNKAKSVNAYGETSVWFYSDYMSLVFIDKKLQQVNSSF